VKIGCTRLCVTGGDQGKEEGTSWGRTRQSPQTPQAAEITAGRADTAREEEMVRLEAGIKWV
jgi:hypothetical protein